MSLPPGFHIATDTTDELKAAFKAAGGGMLPEPTDEEWQALLEWSQPGTKPPPTAVSYAVRCYRREGSRPRTLPRARILRICNELLGVDLAGCYSVFRRGGQKIWQIDKLAEYIGKEFGIRSGRIDIANHKARRANNSWARVLGLLSAELLIAKILGTTIGAIDRGYELPWDTINPCNAVLNRTSIRDEISVFLSSSPNLSGVSAGLNGDGASDNGSGRDDSDDHSGSLAEREPKRPRLATATPSPANPEVIASQPDNASQPTPPPANPEVIASQPGNTAQPNSDQRSERPSLTDGQQSKPADPQLSRPSPKNMLSKARELVNDLDDYHEKLASAQNEVKALRAELALKGKQLEACDQEGYARWKKANSLCEELDAESERMKNELDRVLVEYQERNDKLAAKICLALGGHGAILPAFKDQASVKQEGK